MMLTGHEKSLPLIFFYPEYEGKMKNVDRESIKYMKTEREDPSWAAQEGRILIPASNIDLIPDMRSTGMSMDIFVRGVGVELTHTENLI